MPNKYFQFDFNNLKTEMFVLQQRRSNRTMEKENSKLYKDSETWKDIDDILSGRDDNYLKKEGVQK